MREGIERGEVRMSEGVGFSKLLKVLFRVKWKITEGF